MEEEAEELALAEEGAQEEGAGSELFGESQDENDVEVDGEMVFELRKILKRHFPLQLFVIQEPPRRKRPLSTP